MAEREQGAPPPHPWTQHGGPSTDAGRATVAVWAQRVLSAIQVSAGVTLFAAICVMMAGIAPTFLGFESFTVYSGSMEPTIHVGALAVVQPVRAGELRPGDIITFRTPLQPDLLITHRLVAVEQAPDGRFRYRTKGDANQVEDLVVVDTSAVLGKVAYSVPYAGYIVEYSKRPAGRVALIAVPLVVLAADYLRGRLRRRFAGSAASSENVGPLVVPVPASEAARLQELLVRGRQALQAGHTELALRAADGVLAADPRSDEAWILKADASPDPTERTVILRAALALNPQSALLQARVAADAADAAGATPGSADHADAGTSPSPIAPGSETSPPAAGTLAPGATEHERRAREEARGARG